jgi:hypothetical protein
MTSKRKRPAKKGVPVAFGRWPGQTPRAQKKQMLTKRAKSMKITLAQPGRTEEQT